MRDFYSDWQNSAYQTASNWLANELEISIDKAMEILDPWYYSTGNGKECFNKCIFNYLYKNEFNSLIDS